MYVSVDFLTGHCPSLSSSALWLCGREVAGARVHMMGVISMKEPLESHSVK